jgi:hypothetical protein
MRRNLLVLVLLGTFACGGSTPQQKTDPQSDPSDLLDAPVVRERDSSGPKASADEPMMVLPETPDAPGRSIDGKIDDEWDERAFRRFDKKSVIQTGAPFWRGSSDASFRVGLEADAGYLYFAIQVKDDVVIPDGDEREFSDGVVIHLRDPGLETLVDSLPKSIGLRDTIMSQTAIAFLPNGAFFRYGTSDAPIAGEMIYSAVDVRKNGYVLEVALQMEVFHQVSTIPLDEIAFRVEVFDGDEPDRPGAQTMLSILPDRGDDSPRMALFSAGGLLPHGKVVSRPPRERSLGRWQHDSGEWSFTSFEEVPKLWMTVGDRSAFEEALRSTDALDDLCRKSIKDVELLEAYTSRGGGFRAGLLLCGARAPTGTCPKGSKSNLFWVGLKKEQDRWVLAKYTNVFGEELGQCTNSTWKGGVLYEKFSLLPVDAIDNDVWVVGWTRKQTADWGNEAINGVHFLNVEKDGPIATVSTLRRTSQHDERVRANSSVYLVPVDKEPGLDICQLETVVDQYCRGVDRGCETQEHGTYVHSIIQLYKPRTKRFDRYDLNKHPNCSATTFEPSNVDGYMLLQNEGRVGILKTKKSGAGGGGGEELF